MIRSRALHWWMARLAGLAIVLMLCAPLLSRALQAPMPRLAELCTSAGMKQVDLSALAPPMSGVAKAMPGEGAAGDHAGHGGQVACDYCLLAIRLLPLLFCALLVLAWRESPRPASPSAPVFSSSVRWPAHAARGPPLYA